MGPSWLFRHHATSLLPCLAFFFLSGPSPCRRPLRWRRWPRTRQQMRSSCQVGPGGGWGQLSGGASCQAWTPRWGQELGGAMTQAGPAVIWGKESGRVGGGRGQLHWVTCSADGRGGRHVRVPHPVTVGHVEHRMNAYQSGWVGGNKGWQALLAWPIERTTRVAGLAWQQGTSTAAAGDDRGADSSSCNCAEHIAVTCMHGGCASAGAPYGRCASRRPGVMDGSWGLAVSRRLPCQPMCYTRQGSDKVEAVSASAAAGMACPCLGGCDNHKQGPGAARLQTLSILNVCWSSLQPAIAHSASLNPKP